MKRKTIWQYVAVISYFAGLITLAAAYKISGVAGMILTDLVFVFWAIALWCVMFRPVK